MKTRITVLLLALCMGLTTVSQAAFVVKKETKTEQVATTEAQSQTTAEESANVTTVAAEPKAHAQQQSFFHKLFKSGKAEISKGVYVLLAIIGLGFLGIGLNENFEGINWIIGLVLCLLFWLPGLIYALIMMKNYYK